MRRVVFFIYRKGGESSKEPLSNEVVRRNKKRENKKIRGDWRGRRSPRTAQPRAREEDPRGARHAKENAKEV